MMIKMKARKAYRHEIENKLGKDASGKEVLDYLFGTYNNDYRPNNGYYLYKWCSDKRKWWQRLNMLWAMPLTILIMPFQWIICGNTGWSTKNSIGRLVLRVTGHLKEDR